MTFLLECVSVAFINVKFSSCFLKTLVFYFLNQNTFVWVRNNETVRKVSYSMSRFVSKWLPQADGSIPPPFVIFVTANKRAWSHLEQHFVLLRAVSQSCCHFMM